MTVTDGQRRSQGQVKCFDWLQTQANAGLRRPALDGVQRGRPIVFIFREGMHVSSVLF